MKYDEFAFVNQQLAGMLKTGIPLEGALKQLCATMRRGELRAELQRLEADLAQGAPLEAALASRRLPEFYTAMLRVGVAGGDLPGVLTLLADYYHQANAAWVRLKGLMVYPLIVLAAAFALSLALSIIFGRLRQEVADSGFGVLMDSSAWITMWISPVLLAALGVALVTALLLPSARAWLRWRLPGFRESSLAQMASSLHILLARGCSLNDALGLMRRLEGGSAAGAELAHWQERLSQGHGKVEDFAGETRTFPRLFIWLAGNAGGDLAAGFRRAAELYQGRAAHRIEMMLYACLPVSILLLGLMILGQVYPLARMFIAFNNALGSDGPME